MERRILQEQIAYYRARAPEYRDIIPSSGPLAVVRQSLLKLGPLQHILELAPGTGVWTQELVRIGQVVTAIDASPEMIEINRRRVSNTCVEYHVADLFEWEPHQEYDLVFFAFWLSHVPPELVGVFLVKVRDAVRPNGHLFIVDQCDDLPDYSIPERDGIFETRRLSDGRAFTIVKVYYHPGALVNRIRQLGFQADARRVGPFFYLEGTKSAG